MLHLLDYQLQLLQDFFLEQEQHLLLLVNTHFSDHVKIRFISQLINGISSVLQKLFKCFNGIAVSTSFDVLMPSNSPVILVL